MSKPLKRHEALKPLSRDHHHGLLLCWKIREGFKKDISPDRIKAYASYFYETQLIPHFEFEEKEIFPLLGQNNQLVKQAVSQHRRLTSLFTEDYEPEQALNEIKIALEDHIRFEERTLFQEVQVLADDGVLDQIAEKQNKVETPDPDDWEDAFWKK